jgi:hypothetical protein
MYFFADWTGAEVNAAIVKQEKYIQEKCCAAVRLAPCPMRLKENILEKWSRPAG